MMRVIRRYTIEIDDRPHEYQLCYDPLFAAAAELRDQLWFWAEYDDSEQTFVARLQVVRDGENLPGRALWLGTVVRGISGGQPALHLVELPSP